MNRTHVILSKQPFIRMSITTPSSRERFCEHMQFRHFTEAAFTQQYYLSEWSATIPRSVQENGLYFPESLSTLSLGIVFCPKTVTVAFEMDRRVFFARYPSRLYCLHLLALKL